MTTRRPTAALAPGFALALMLAPADPARADGGEAAMEQGSAAYAELCAGCHASAARIVRRVQGDTDAARGEWLEGFLKTHYAPDDEKRAALIAYLLTQ